MSEPFVGEIKMFGGNYAPQGYALCNGQLLPIAQNQALFSILGTYFGGDGRVNFGLPNLQGRAPIHWGSIPGSNPIPIGQSGGAQTQTLNATQMPMHTHTATVTGTINVLKTVGNARNPDGAVLAGDSTGDLIYSNQPPDGALAARAFSGTAAIGMTGGNQPFSIQSPYLAVSFIIALTGIYPVRN